ncbi:two component transcriptional regulator, LytTR family [Hymenobacter roseosalivarius DSM 11622]|uniref:Two component transcriptional regulator, LytTR family n=1 Tax=Hymenobacter roseosalivarius DSM 11622 TaxID=645990 RepID=A0A1W1W224_9BACT|nr:LytTR family DNA-binding domain-containing protein [Hymenobacter roseosalivarius]SMB99672.1 two component transcriptional regulator, LytTR family [Hymenobacter roseosalivarius DSM 11622]
MTILILEDESLAARQTVAFLARAGLAPVAQPVVRSVAKALAWLQANPMPDLIFSDIELLDGNVFALYEQVAVKCPVIFTTAYDQFLLPAFQHHGIAYLLKPFDYAQFQQALAKYEELKSHFRPASLTDAPPSLSPAVLRALQQALRQVGHPEYRQRFSVRQRQGLYLLPVEEVAYLQADEGVTFAVDAVGGRYPFNGTLTELERQLDPRRFARLNRSELVNVAFIERAEPYFNKRLAVKLRGPASVVLLTSTAQTPEFRRWLDQ